METCIDIINKYLRNRVKKYLKKHSQIIIGRKRKESDAFDC